jgi:hypothetical protein
LGAGFICSELRDSAGDIGNPGKLVSGEVNHIYFSRSQL